MKKFLFETITKLEKVDYALVIALWVAGMIATIVGFPWIVLGIFAMHSCELVTIGLKAGKNGGVGFFETVAMCMLFGFTWWVPLKYKTNQVTFD